MTTTLKNGFSVNRSNMQRRDLLKFAGAGGLALAAGHLGLGRSAFAAEAKSVAFWGTATLDIGEKWAEFATQNGVKPEFTDNGNDLGPVIARLAAGNANDLFDIGGFQGGAEKELARQGAIIPWDVSKIANYDSIWQWARDIPYLKHDGMQYGIPTVVNADSIIYRSDKLGKVDSYGVIFDPKMKGKVAMEDAWINSAVFAAIYLKESENKPIKDPGNLSESELGLVMEFLIKHKKDGQFRTFWNGWEQGVQLVANEEVDAMTGWEPIVYEGRKRGLKVDYAAPVEGYEGWANNTVLLKGAGERGVSDAAHQFVNGLLGGLYGCELGKARGYLVPTDNNVVYAKAHPDEYNPEEVQARAEHVKAKFAGKVFWQNTRPDNFQLYEEWWQKLRNA
ncbi:extracellular solute-binding protein [Agrobacterium vitis]|uniref:ABC transporter substrate-binding protein n=1 Tax=Rhizobium/Agrobacterium group TaxID=227290 RepID=UPI0008DC162D|nr:MULTISPECIES: extracellular solute-binding protein [Rhizobium/Agrobacterium group]MCF1433110.1 extracellular solute-binding protein [Allorhizobium ampelinum]MUO91419.1 extracellular solute-binding protein [Agrobacterium vitis]MUZ54873.1 extracellular solute-binding protein [Agrobacterium vitis]MUZ93833.1 extracellular solute-binding protein [Agrobacterium vitis]MVA41127.1 extracellular solute-binding protein [Agrobacterium vitis]